MKQNDKKIKELTIRIESLNLEIESLHKEFDIDHEDLAEYTQNRDNFSTETWEALQKQRQALDEKLDLELKNVRDPLETKKRYNERLVAPHWIFVR